MKATQSILAIAIGMFMIACQSEDTTEKTPASVQVEPLSAHEEDELFTQATALFGALPATMPGSENDTKEMVDLGRKLFFEKRLSLNDVQSCNTCHLVDGNRAGVDNMPTSTGVHGKTGDRNSPTVLNAGYHFVQFWDGRAADLVEQAKGPILNPVEMAMASEPDVEKKIGGIPEYQKAFSDAFPDEQKPINYQNIASAIAAFERTLVSRSRFDSYMEGDHTALTDTEKRGLQTFISSGCITCHVKATFGGNMYQKIGLVNEYQSKDAGRFAVTKDPTDSLLFKVPALRNVALTYPYFHDGSVDSLPEAVDLMAWHQLGKRLEKKDVDLIVSFLNSLSETGRTGASTKKVDSEQ